MKTEIKKILYRFLQDGISSDEATQQVLDLFAVSNSSDLYVVELSDEEIKIIDQKELDEWHKSAEEFDGILGFTIRGKLMK